MTYLAENKASKNPPLFSDGNKKIEYRIDLRLDYYEKDVHLIILLRLELDIISD